MIDRKLIFHIMSDLKPGHVTGLYGARRTGKTVIMETMKELLSDRKILVLNGDDFDTNVVLSSRRQEVLKNLVSGYDYLFVDEAQNVKDIGANLKLMVDTQNHISVFVTGSASFDLRNKIGEPLTGRSRFFTLHPFSVSEVTDNYLKAMQILPVTLIYGLYPQVFLSENFNEKRSILEGIRNGYLLRDVLQLDNVKDSLFVMNLLQRIAFQIGNDVSYNQLAISMGTTVKTIQRYLDILEKCFIIFRLNGFSRNLAKELQKSPRFYFFDNGIRNAIISNFNPVETRDDVGKLWENFCISERLKRQMYNQEFSNFYFWRTYDQQEIDLIEENNLKLSAYEFKWGAKEPSSPKAFRENYPGADFTVINKLNFYNFFT